MKRFAMKTIVVALSLSISGIALAQHRPGPQRSPGPQKHVQKYDSRHKHQRVAPQVRRAPPPRARAPVYRHAHFKKGAYLPHQYRYQQYYVSDWRRHGLNRPPHNHRWVQVGTDYLLVGIVSGVIVHMLTR